MANAVRRHDYALLAYVVMPDHAHVIVFPRREVYDIAGLLSAIKLPVARQAMAYLREAAPHWLDRLTRRRGRRVERLFWQSGGGFDRNVFSPEIRHRMVDYIHNNNPVRKKLVGRPTDWYWSSARWYAGERDGPLEIDDLPS